MRLVQVLSRVPDGRGRFSVMVDGRWLEDWSLDRVKRAVAEGVRLEEREAS